MATVILNREIARQFTDGATEIDVASDNIRAVIRELDAGFRTALEQLAAVRAERDAMRQTWSWRLTAPLRALQRALRG